MADTEPRPSSRPRRQKVSDSEVEAMMEEGLSLADMSRRLADQGVTMSVAGLSLRKRAILDRKQEAGERLLPWTISAEHAQNLWVYSAVLAYAKMRAGRGLSDRDRRLALEFEQEMHALDSVIYYTREAGFVTRRRRPDDGPSVLVKA